MDTELLALLEEMARLKREMEAFAQAQRTDRDDRIEALGHDLEERLDREFRRIDARLAALTDARVGGAAGGDPIPELEILDPMFGKGMFDVSAHPNRHRRHLIMPIHTPKIVHLSSVFDQLRKEPRADDILWTLVTTSVDERRTLEEYVSAMKPFIPLDFEIVSATELCDLLGFTQLKNDIIRNANGGIINVKKLVAIYRALSLGAEEICCMDSDVIFLGSPASVFDRVGENYRKGVFFSAGCPNDNTREIVRASASYLLPTDAAVVASIMGESRFSWFFDVPFYPKDHGRQFFAYIQYCHGGLEAALRRLSWYSFDHIVFMNFLIRNGAFRMVDTTALVGADSITDELSLQQIRHIADVHDYTPAWAPLYSILEEKEPALRDGFGVAFHVDRIKPAI